MISIIICSRRADISSELKDNIASTIGCEYELCVIDNSHNDYSIFSAYNEGIARATGDVLCFVHDDVLFRTTDWGTIISEIFTDSSIGLIGFAGAHFLPQTPLYWWSSPYISQYNLQADKGVQLKNENIEFFNGDLADVVMVDGLCMFMPKSLFEHVRFDDTYYSGFHAYDMDISMQVIQKGYRVCVSRSIVIEHFWSESSFENINYMKKLYTNVQLFCQKWQHQLPISRGIDISTHTLECLNQLCAQAYDAKKARQSYAYRIGRTILTPINALKKLFAKNHQ